MKPVPSESLVQNLALLLRNHVDDVLDGSRVVSFLTPGLQVVTRLYEQLVSRTPGTGFLAVKSYPSDVAPVLLTQFLLDMLQKTHSLKLIHPSDCPDQLDVNIFPFKSLRSLELRCLSLHCMRGLRNVYSQLEVLICFRCVTSLEEVISLCGGDLNPALPWLYLHTLNFRYNKIRSLDKSLELLNALQILDLSHNLIEDCGSHLKVLSDLQYLNLGYNFLTSVPELNVESSVQLHTLVLRHNQLSSTTGLEHLYNLQHLDLSYNLLVKHSKLSGLAQLENLRQLFLEGNPLYFHKDYPAIATQHLSPKASDKVLLDGKPLSKSETMGVGKSVQNADALREKDALPQPLNSPAESSCTVDLTDNGSAPEKISPKPIPCRKSKVKVRKPSISKFSDSECEPRRQKRSQPVVKVLQHQKDIDRTETFRKQFGADWLQYRSHLEDELSRENSPDSERQSPCVTTTISSSLNVQMLIESITKVHGPGIPSSSSAKPSPEDNSVAPTNVLLEEIEDVEEDDIWQRRPEEEEEEEEEADLKKDGLCTPVMACPVVDGQPLDPDWPWVFLTVTPQYLLEIELKCGKVDMKRELRSLKDIQIATAKWCWNGREEELPLLTLSFQSLYEGKQTVSFIVLDNSKDINIKTLLDFLYPVLEENVRLVATDKQSPTMLQCLKCKIEFIHEKDGGSTQTPKMMSLTEEQTPDDTHTAHTGCPSCRSFHVILAPLQPSADTPTPRQSPDGAEGQGQKSFYLGEQEDNSETKERKTSRWYDILKARTSDPLTSYTYEAITPPPTQNSPTSEGSTHLDLGMLDHRLKLYLDMEILKGELEEFQSSLKVSVVRFGKPEDFWALVVVSNQKIYFLEITKETRGPPGDWLKLGEAHALTSLTHLHVGLQQQCVYLGFQPSDAAYTLLTRNCTISTSFIQHIMDSLAGLPRRYLNSLQYSPEEELSEDHRLWQFLHDSLGEDNQPEYYYVLAHFIQEDPASAAASDSCVNADLHPKNRASSPARAQGARAATPVSLLVTKTHMYILEETHQWLHVAAPSEKDDGKEPPTKVTVIEKQAIVSICSLHLFYSAPLHLCIKLYKETKQETTWHLWTEDPALPMALVEWFRVPWEDMYDIELNQVTHETPSPYQLCE